MGGPPGHPGPGLRSCRPAPRLPPGPWPWGLARGQGRGRPAGRTTGSRPPRHGQPARPPPMGTPMGGGRGRGRGREGLLPVVRRLLVAVGQPQPRLPGLRPVQPGLAGWPPGPGRRARRPPRHEAPALLRRGGHSAPASQLAARVRASQLAWPCLATRPGARRGRAGVARRPTAACWPRTGGAGRWQRPRLRPYVATLGRVPVRPRAEAAGTPAAQLRGLQPAPRGRPPAARPVVRQQARGR